MDAIQRMRARLAEIEGERADIITALKVVERFSDTSNGTADSGDSQQTPSEKSSLIGTTASRAAFVIMSEIGQEEGISFHEVYKKAEERGYQGQPDAIRKAMSKENGEYEQLGGGKYRLRTAGPHADMIIAE